MAERVIVTAGGSVEEIVLAVPDCRWYELDAPQRAALEQALQTLTDEAAHHGLAFERRRDWERCRDLYIIKRAPVSPIRDKPEEVTHV